MKESDFIFHLVQLMYYKCHKVSFIRSGSYIDSSDWIRKKKATLNPKNTDDKCFQYTAAIALNYGKIESHPERVSSIKPFINEYNWEGVNYPSKIDDWKMFEKNNPRFAVNIVYTKEKKYVHLYL